MFCPQCGASQSDDVKFCKSCGGNLSAVRQAVATRDTGGKIDWSKTWVAEMFLSEAEHEKRKQQRERELGITPEVKREKELKAGVVTASVGIGVSIFLFVLMRGIILSLHNPGTEIEILSRVWVAGVIPFFVGLGLMINGLFVGRSKRKQATTEPLEGDASYQSLPSGDPERLIRSPYSVTEQTTRHLEDSDQKQLRG
ncbi:MAG TPA: zinc-ribbon domain-containing protein [Blastocatellia bacterium]|nr:zinc-ribbon domain-containing protein [Blastocatellia bacterium]